MAKTTISFAAALMLLGVGAYAATGMRSWTALIPAIAGVLLLICGLIAQNPARKMHAMHAAVLLAILGVAGCVPGVIKLIKLVTQDEKVLTADDRAAAGMKDDQVMLADGKIVRPVAAKVQAAMAGLLLPYIALCVKSFMDARRNRPSQ